MGFQFNHVGGGTKTRRPITINMKYNMTCTEPVCYLMRDDTLWEVCTLPCGSPTLPTFFKYKAKYTAF